MRAMVMPSLTQTQVKRSVGSKDRMEANRRTDGNDRSHYLSH